MRLRRNPVGMSVAADPELRTPPRRSRAGGRPPRTEMPVPAEVTVVRVGPKGKRTHIHDPSRPSGVLCSSGTRSPTGQTGNQNKPELFESEAQFVTCTRCQKLGVMNQRKYGSFLRPGE